MKSTNLALAVTLFGNASASGSLNNPNKQRPLDHEDVLRKLAEMSSKMEDQAAKIEEQSLKIKALEEEMSSDRRSLGMAANPNEVLACYDGYETMDELFTPRVYAANYIDNDCYLLGDGYENPFAWFPGFNVGFNTEIVPLGVIHSTPAHGVMVDVSLASGTLIWSLDLSVEEFDIDLDAQVGVSAVSVTFVETCDDGSGWAPENCDDPEVKYADPPVVIYDAKVKANVNFEFGPILQFGLDLTASSHHFKFLSKGDLAPNKRYVVAAKFYYFAVAGSIDPALHGVGVWVGARSVTSQIVKMSLDMCDLDADDYPGLEEELLTIDPLFGGCNIFDPCANIETFEACVAAEGCCPVCDSPGPTGDYCSSSQAACDLFGCGH